jgi:hypothetical protein
VSTDFISRPQPAGDRFAEKRAVPRYHLIAEIEVLEPIQQVKLTAYTAEIGANGCYVRVGTPLQKNTVIQVRIQKDREMFKTWGRVVYTQPGTGMGIAFFRPDTGHEKILQGWLDNLKVHALGHESESSSPRRPT